MRQGRLLDLRSQARSGRRRVPCGRSRWACGRRWEAGPSGCVGGGGLADAVFRLRVAGGLRPLSTPGARPAYAAGQAPGPALASSLRSASRALRQVAVGVRAQVGGGSAPGLRLASTTCTTPRTQRCWPPP